MDKPVRDHPRRRHAAAPNKTGSWRTERAVYVERPAALQPRLPGRRGRPGLAVRRRGGRRRLRARLAHDHGDQPVPRGDGPDLLPPVRDRLQPRPARRVGRDQLGRALPRRRGDPAGLDGEGRRATLPASGCWSSAPARPAWRRPTTWPGTGTTVTIRESGAEAGRDDALRHPGLPPAPRRPRRRDPADPRSRGAPRAGHPVTDLDATMRRGSVRRRVPRRRCPDRQARLPPGRLGGPRPRRGHRCCTTSRRANAPLLGRRVAVYGGGNTAIDAARTAKRLGADDAVVVYRRTRDRMPAHDTEVREAEEEGIALPLALHDHPGRGRPARRRADGARRVRLPAADRRDRRARRRRAWCSRSARTPTSPARRGRPTSRSSDGVVEVDRQLMTGHPGVFAGGDMVPDVRSATVAIGHGRRAARSIDAWLRRVAAEPADERRAGWASPR